MTDSPQNDENSFEEYKKYLEESIGVLNLKPPSKPMNAFMRYFFERSCEERSKGNKEWKKMTNTISEEWKKLPGNKKQYYEKMYEIRMKERAEIYEEYERLAKNKKPATAWARFFKKRYGVYATQHPSYSAKEITKLVSQDWRKIPEKEKAKLEQEYEEEKALLANSKDNTERIDRYKETVEKYNEELNEQKEKIMKKYGVSKQSLDKLRQVKKAQDRQKKALESEQRRRLKNEKRRKEREEKARKEREERQQLKKQKQEVQEKEKQKLQEQKQRARSLDKSRAQKASEPAPVKNETTEIKTETKEKAGSKGRPASKKVAAKKAESPAKTKKIEKAPRKALAKKSSSKPAKKQAEPAVKKESPAAGKKGGKGGKSVAKTPAKANARRGRK